MIRVLQVYPQMNNAGTERVILNLYENIDREQVQFDFLVERPGYLDNKLRGMGAKIYYLPANTRREYFNELLAFFKDNPQYRIVHAHTHANMSIVLKAANQSGIPCRIAHSHNARNDLPKVAAFVKGLTCIPMEHYANHFFACSSNAAKWRFPHRVKECKVLYNGIKLNDYFYCAENRKNARTQLGIRENEFVMIHVGRFAKQKNHEFLVRVLKAYSQKDCSNWKMLLVGEGPLEDMIKQQVKAAGLSDHVVFLGARCDTNKLYSAADLFLFPSLYEGLGIVVIEAQTSGLPCIVSNAIPPEANLQLNLITTLQLTQSPEEWAKAIGTQSQSVRQREELTGLVLNSAYSIKEIAVQMQQFYLENGK